MWQPLLLITLVVAVSAVLGQLDQSPPDRCTHRLVGDETFYPIELQEKTLYGYRVHDVPVGALCRYGMYVVGVRIEACSQYGRKPPTILPTSNINVVYVRTHGRTTVNMIAYCQYYEKLGQPEEV